MHRTLIASLVLIIISFGCKENSYKSNKIQEPSSPTNHPLYVEAIESAHKRTIFESMETVCFNLEITFGSSKSKFKIFTTPNSSNIKIEKTNGLISLLKNGIFYTNADSSQWKSEKFGLFTYHYFFMAPYKLSDPGTSWKKLPASTFGNKEFNTSMLTFDQGTGDTPDDWYILHTDQKTNLIDHMGYIVTGGDMTQAEAEKNAHAIKYEDYRNVDGVPMSHHWKFYNYDKTSGLGKDQIGEGVLKNILFMDIFEDTYDTTDLIKVN